MTKTRDNTIDIVKAVGIILMVIGHFSGLPLWFEKWIFSFHMPLFFVFSGYFFKEKPLIDTVSSGLRKLVWPYVFTIAGCAALIWVFSDAGHAVGQLAGAFYGCQGNSGARYVLSTNHAGPIWFLLALFWCRIFFALIYHHCPRHYLSVSCVIGLPAVWLSSEIVNIPLCVSPGAIALIFYATGLKLKEIGLDSFKGWHLAAMTCFWLICSQKGYLNMACHMYTLYYLVIVGAVFGTIVTYKACSFISGRIAEIMAFVGRNTLDILCCHAFAFVTRRTVVEGLGLAFEDNMAQNISLLGLTVIYFTIWALSARLVSAARQMMAAGSVK